MGKVIFEDMNKAWWIMECYRDGVNEEMFDRRTDQRRRPWERTCIEDSARDVRDKDGQARSQVCLIEFEMSDRTQAREPINFGNIKF